MVPFGPVGESREVLQVRSLRPAQNRYSQPGDCLVEDVAVLTVELPCRSEKMVVASED